MRDRFQRELHEVSPPPPPTGTTGTKPVTAAKPAWSILVVDADNKPIDGEPYLAFQPGVSAHGTLKKGLADMGRMNPLDPFRFEAGGRALSIKEGAVLVVDDPRIEYGGTAVDWSDADTPNADRTFWPQYTKYRTTFIDGPSSFLQHEHLTRRQIRIRQAYAPGSGRTPVLSAWPVRIRVGPLVRFVNATSAVIWVETRTPAIVRVRFGKKADARASLSEAYASSVRAGGRHYCAIELPNLTEDTLFEYTLELASQQASGGILIDQAGLKGAFPKLSTAVLDAMKAQLKGASFSGTEWLNFRTLRNHYQKLRFVHGSCRKYPDFDKAGKDDAGPDTMIDLQKFMAKMPVDQWPRFMLLTGDQIYADDIGEKQGLAIGRHRWGRVKPGPSTNDGDGAWAGRYASRFTGVTKAPRNQKFRIDNHLLWNVPVDAKNTHIGLLYPPPDPKTGRVPDSKKEDRPAGDTSPLPHPELAPDGRPLPIHAADFAEYAFLYECAWARGDPIRKVLANVPTFMTFDDHEVTDDWNADRRWLDNVHRPPKGAPEYWPETIADALAAYWMYQGWGNQSPADWATDPRSKLLVAHMKAGTDALPSLRVLLRRDLEPPSSLAWDFALPIASPIFYSTDCRMRRILKPKKPSFDDRVLDRAGLDKMRALLTRSTAPVTFLIASSPILMPGLIGESFTYTEASLRPLGIKFDAFTKVFDEGFRRKRDIEHWVANQSWFDVLRFLSDLSKDSPNLKAVVALSGDVHFSYNIVGRLDPKQAFSKALKLKPPRLDKKGRAFPYLLQLVSSGIKQQLNKSKTYAVRVLVEDDIVIGKESPPDKDTKDLRRLSRGFGISNRLWSPKYVKEDYDFGGMNLRIGGFENFDPRRALLVENSIAVVDVSIDAKASTFTIVEQYVTHKGVPKFTYEMTAAGDKQTVPRLPPSR